MDNWWRTLLQILYPIKCLSCRQPGEWLCAACRSHLHFNHSDFCLVCGRPSSKGFTHQNCLSSYSPQRLLSCFSFQGLPAALVKALKYRGYWPLASEAAALMATFLKERGVLFSPETLVTSVPFDWRRRLTKPANHGQLLAKALAKELNLSYAELLVRSGWSVSQTMLSRSQRQVNVAGKFSILPKWQNYLQNKSILLVDDVVTTGATLREAGGVLLKTGVKDVCCFTLARG